MTTPDLAAAEADIERANPACSIVQNAETGPAFFDSADLMRQLRGLETYLAAQAKESEVTA